MKAPQSTFRQNQLTLDAWNMETPHLDDRQIDQLVYELYGLTKEEIRIVEEATAQPAAEEDAEAVSEDS